MWGFTTPSGKNDSHSQTLKLKFAQTQITLIDHLRDFQHDIIYNTL